MPRENLRSLAFCIPASGRPVPLDFFLAVPNIPNPPNLYVIRMTVVKQKVAETRNALIKSALEHECRLIFFLDDDVVPPRDALTRLVYQIENHPEAAMVSAVVCSKQDPPAPCVFNRAGDGPLWDWTVGDLFEAPGGVGLACALIRAEYLERLDPPWCKFEDSQIQVGPTEFDMHVSEDLFLSNRLRELGGKILVDGGILCAHHDVATGRVYELPKDSMPWRRARERQRESRELTAESRQPTVDSKAAAPAVKRPHCYAVVLPDPPGYVHIEALREIWETVHFGLVHMGMDSQLTREPLPDCLNIILGTHILDPSVWKFLPADSIIYHTEPFGEDGASFHPDVEAMRPFRAWNMSKANHERALALGLNSQYVPLGYVREMTRIQNRAKPDIDALFYGAVTPRRKAIVDELRKAGLRVPEAEALFGRYGAARDEFMARAKMILQINSYVPRVMFASARVVYALANRKPVLCEWKFGEEMEEDLKPGILLTWYDDMVRNCVRLAGMQNVLAEKAEAGFDAVRRRDESDILRAALGL